MDKEGRRPVALYPSKKKAKNNQKVNPEPQGAGGKKDIVRWGE